VGSIAIVHETLSTSVEEFVEFDEIADRLAHTVADVGSVAGRVQVRRLGSFGHLPSETATPLAMVLTELVQNAVEHAFTPASFEDPVGSGDPARDESGLLGQITLTVDRGPDRLKMSVADDGRGLPEGFDLDRTNLGLSIVRTLVESELAGSLQIGPTPSGIGTAATIDVPL